MGKGLTEAQKLAFTEVAQFTQLAGGAEMAVVDVSEGYIRVNVTVVQITTGALKQVTFSIRKDKEVQQVMDGVEDILVCALRIRSQTIKYFRLHTPPGGGEHKTALPETTIIESIGAYPSHFPCCSFSLCSDPDRCPPSGDDPLNLRIEIVSKLSAQAEPLTDVNYSPDPESRRAWLKKIESEPSF